MCFLPRERHHRDLHSFPTRRSSDLLEAGARSVERAAAATRRVVEPVLAALRILCGAEQSRSEEHTSELQSHSDLVCRLLLEKKKTITALAEGSLTETKLVEWIRSRM